MSRVLQETITGSTLNGRKEYLKADEGDKDKWEFLSFASAWTPSEMVLSPEGNTGNVTDDGIFFTHVSWKKEVIFIFGNWLTQLIKMTISLFCCVKIV